MATSPTSGSGCGCAGAAPLVDGTLLDDRCLGRGLFDPRAIRAVVADHLGGRRNHTYLILALLIFERGRRAFVDGDDPAAAPPPAEAIRV